MKQTKLMAGAGAVLGIALGFASSGASAQLDDKAALAIMNKAACSACHTVDKKGVGPSYKEVSAKRKGQKDSAIVLADKIRKGGSGIYGQIPMPGNPADKVSDEEVKQMVTWILSK